MGDHNQVWLKVGSQIQIINEKLDYIHNVEAGTVIHIRSTKCQQVTLPSSQDDDTSMEDQY